MIWVLLAIMVVTTVFGDLLQSHEMKSSAAQEAGVGGIGRFLRFIAGRLYLILAIVCMAVSFFAFMALLQRAPLSFAVPASAGTLILETLLARVILREKVGMLRWIGATLVAFGVVLLSY